MNCAEMFLKYNFEKDPVGIDKPPGEFIDTFHPPQIGDVSTNPPVDKIVIFGPYVSDSPSQLVAGITTDGKQPLWVKTIRPTNQGIYEKYGDLQNIQTAIINGTKHLQQFNPYMAVYAANILPLESLPVGQRSKNVIALAPPISKGNLLFQLDPRYPVAVITPDFRHGSSLQEMLKNGPLELLELSLPPSLAKLHKEKAGDITHPKALEYGTFEAFKSKFDFNFQDFMLALDIRREFEQEGKIDGIWEVKYTDLVQKLYQKVFVVHEQFFTKLFHEAIQKGLIKRYHGDLKTDHVVTSITSPNIIVPADAPLADFWHYYDLIDFNDKLEHGHIFADFAYLCIDMQRRLRPEHLHVLSKIITRYFENIGQEIDESTRIMFALFLWEKATMAYPSNVIYKHNTNGLKEILKTSLVYAEELNELLDNLSK